ncbi:nucleoside 2-deoxyribosyltransferase [Pseudooceanicola algae]|uniref:Uncharacterized protein n=1 Tax=Pseudooceanicola algae TaxID=1537215 RepID=A0A418SFX6_9RHOB|nr:nucleoside 2-deoxyribosyltransferase [Pseudooceanicola algae]QPM91542.1 hypothetical protein PSAL_027960 [Pseudooceanicola algae]
MKVYLAGPEVFYADFAALSDRRKALARAAGFTPSGPGSDQDKLDDAEITGLSIYRNNLQMMQGADLCIANLTPFRGPAADPGTVWEMGYLTGRGIPVFAFSFEPRDYRDRIEAWAGETATEAGDGLLRLSDGIMVENHGMSDNLMMEGSLMDAGTPFVRAAPGETEDSVLKRVFALAAETLGVSA